MRAQVWKVCGTSLGAHFPSALSPAPALRGHSPLTRPPPLNKGAPQSWGSCAGWGPFRFHSFPSYLFSLHMLPRRRGLPDHPRRNKAAPTPGPSSSSRRPVTSIARNHSPSFVSSVSVPVRMDAPWSNDVCLLCPTQALMRPATAAGTCQVFNKHFLNVCKGVINIKNRSHLLIISMMSIASIIPFAVLANIEVDANHSP